MTDRACTVGFRSTPYPNRRDTGVRVYLEVSPE
jgi:hypothetical protein